MNIHEYQGKELFRKYGIPVPKGMPAFTVPEAVQVAKQLISETGSEVVVVKAQIHAGGRGKGGGVKVVKGAQAAEETAEKILGMNLVTHQTGPAGKKVQRLLVEDGRVVALNMAGQRAAYEDIPMYSSSLFDSYIRVIGLTPENYPDLEALERLDRESRSYQRLFFLDGRLVGAALIGEMRYRTKIFAAIRSKEQIPCAERQQLLDSW